jgi:DNA repair protein RadA/Sms
MYDESFPSTSGSIVQVRETALRLQQIAKLSKIAIILVGHVTKEGVVAGPRILEHMIDYLLYLEGDQHHDLRILRGVKNRFGSTDEVGVFKLSENGFKEVYNQGELFLSDRKGSPTVGSCIGVTLEGTRPFLVEVQALATKTIFGYPKRTVSGPDINRVHLISTILQKRVNIKLDTSDLYVSSIGGISIREPAMDLSIGLAIVSTERNMEIDSQICAIGELDLVGRIRPTFRQKIRINEAKRLGYDVISSEKFQTLNQVFQSLFTK